MTHTFFSTEGHWRDFSTAIITPLSFDGNLTLLTMCELYYHFISFILLFHYGFLQASAAVPVSAHYVFLNILITFTLLKCPPEVAFVEL